MIASLTLHIIGLVLWVGGLILLPRFIVVAPPASFGGVRRVFWGFVVAGGVIAAASGLYQIAQRGAAFYFSQGWFHTKLTLVGVLVVLTALLGSEIARGASGRGARASRLMMIHGISALSMAAIVFLTINGRTL